MDKINNNILIDANYSNTNLINIEQEEKIDSNQLKLVGLYDPAENDLNLNMWELSDGEKIIKLVEKIEKIELSKDAQNLYKDNAFIVIGVIVWLFGFIFEVVSDFQKKSLVIEIWTFRETTFFFKVSFWETWLPRVYT